MPVLRQFVVFSCVGAAGFLVDSAVLMIMIKIVHSGLYGSRFVSFLCAVTFTWAANRHLTFRSASPDRPLKQWLHFASLNALGGAINLGVYALLVAKVPLAAHQPILGVAAGSIAGLLINFILSRMFVFRSHLGRAAPTRTT